MNIQVGAELMVRLKSHETSFTTFFVGEKTNEHIVLAFPKQLSLHRKALDRLGEVSVEYSEGGIRYEFKTRIREILEEPTDLILLEYPTEIHRAEKRSLKRINCLVSAKLEIKFDNKSQSVVGAIENISKTGCLCIVKKIEGVKEPLSLGDLISLRCQFPGLVGEQIANGEIVHIQEKQGDIVTGIHFDKKLWWIPPYDSEEEAPSI
ncbi:MAG TPA: PilZ domain-containing protein [Desulfatiglandales bacterium]|nr:PilZ domain-containing protein [Desulfatiglandales bacterium]